MMVSIWVAVLEREPAKVRRVVPYERKEVLYNIFGDVGEVIGRHIPNKPQPDNAGQESPAFRQNRERRLKWI